MQAYQVVYTKSFLETTSGLNPGGRVVGGANAPPPNLSTIINFAPSRTYV